MPDTRLADQRGHSPVWDRDRTNSRSAFYAAVFSLVALIPRGRVTTYGTLAYTLGRPNGARSVGWALSVAPHAASLPCHRVVNRDGFLSGGWHWGHPDIMASLLHDEGVPFLAPHRVDLRACHWVPDEDVGWTLSQGLGEQSSTVTRHSSEQQRSDRLAAELPASPDLQGEGG